MIVYFPPFLLRAHTLLSKFICDLYVLHFHFVLLCVVAVSSFSVAVSNTRVHIAGSAQRGHQHRSQETFSTS